MEGELEGGMEEAESEKMCSKVVRSEREGEGGRRNTDRKAEKTYYKSGKETLFFKYFLFCTVLKI